MACNDRRHRILAFLDNFSERRLTKYTGHSTRNSPPAGVGRFLSFANVVVRPNSRPLISLARGNWLDQEFVKMPAIPRRLGALPMGATVDDARARAARTYNAAADVYDDPANSFWERFGRRTVERLQLRKGAMVLDVCCGSGASALPAAEIVGPSGFVLGIDLAERLLENARAKAKARALLNVQFRVGDLLDLRIPDDQFDAVVCVFGIFFVPDMSLALRLLWERVRSGGKLAITTWGPRFFEPATTAFWRSIRKERPDLYKGFNPWDRICDPQSLRALFAEAGIANPDMAAESDRHSISSPEAWWAAVLGSGYRGTVDQLDAAARERVRAANFEFIRNSGTASVEANVVYAVAEKT